MGVISGSLWREIETAFHSVEAYFPPDCFKWRERADFFVSKKYVCCRLQLIFLNTHILALGGYVIENNSLQSRNYLISPEAEPWYSKLKAKLVSVRG